MTPAPAEPLFTPRFAMLWVYAFVTFFSAFQLLPAIPFRILELGGSKAEAGWFLSVYTFSSAFAAPVMGTIADHLGRRRLLITASILFIGFSVAYGLVRNLPLLFLIAAIHGAIWSGILASASALMSEYIPESRRTQGMAYWGLASTGAIAIAPAVGLWVYHFGWMTLCFELAAISVVMVFGALLLRVDEKPASPRRLAVSDAWDWRVIATALSLTVASFGYGGMTSYAAIIAVERHITPVAIYLTTYAISIVLFRVCFSHLGDRIGPKRVLYPALVLVPLAFAWLGIAHTRWEMIASATLFGIGFGAAYPAFVTIILGSTDPARRARTFGSIVWAFDTGIGTGSFAIGAIGQHFGLTKAFLVAAALSCFSIPIFAWASARLTGSGFATEPEHARAN
ncbi:MAG TPA: MFS transporter [Thermoanaerobaculia bacterium]|jgi:MFS family permease|nr:MFS transporter [Thermoanaerobaculia bacterium]